jgi:carboxypeptidase Taq
MVSGELKTEDIPQAWNQKMRDYLGLTPPDAARGVLQDIHWALADIGYFPTYTLGNLYAAQFFQQAQKDLSDLDGHLANGQFSLLRDWLNKNIYSQGKRYTARELITHVTGQDLSARSLLNRLRGKAAEIYHVESISI